MITVPPETTEAKNKTPPPNNEKTSAVAAPVKKVERLFSFIVLIVLLGVMGLLASIVAPGPLKETKNVIIAHGATTRSIAAQLDTEGTLYNPLLFRAAAKLLTYNALHAGEYQITPKQSIASIVLMMHAGKSIVHRFTIAEGLTSAEVVRLLNNTTALAGTITAYPPEGSLFPDTYLYTYGDSRAAMIDRMQKGMHDALDDVWNKREPSINLTSEPQVVILASVVEKETGKASERPRIAGVFYNRLKQHMRLQSDPTVIYAIAQAKGFLDHDLGHDDMAFPSPINTYVTDGLPSQPICNPGRAALEAVTHPEDSDYLYFVADGTGGHVFSRTLAEHNQNVVRWSQMKNKTP
jgi:UPF0755 protein